MSLTTIITEDYSGLDRRDEPRRKADRRKTVVEIYDEDGERSTRRGELLDIEV